MSVAKPFRFNIYTNSPESLTSIKNNWMIDSSISIYTKGRIIGGTESNGFPDKLRQ